jgi:hypothetical protein
MENIRPSTRNIDHHGHRSEHQPELHALLKENKQLRELVIQLSKIVIKNVVDQK